MSAVVVGLNHRTVPLRVLEPMTVPSTQQAKALHDLRSRDHLGEVVVLSTCMRTEIYALATRFHGGVNDIRNFLSAWSGAPPEEFSDGLYSYYDEAAVRHLFRVAAGLESAVLGEGEILGQVRDAWEAARLEGAAGPVLGLLFRQAVEVGKRVRSETAISRGTTSLSQAAVAMAAERLGTLAGRTAVVVGAGRMGGAVAQAVAAAPGAGQVLVANRTWQRARDLAERCGGRPVPWEHLAGALGAADVVLSSTAAPEVLLGPAEVGPALASRGGRPLLLVDIAVPRDIDPAVGALPGVTLLDMDDLEAFADTAMAGRRQEVPRAETIVEEEVDRYQGVAAQRHVAPLIAALHQRAEDIRIAELARLDGRLAGLDARQRRAVEGLTRGIIAKLLHEPTVNVKAGAGTPTGEQLAQALRHLFEL